ncbi:MULTISPECIES: hypothetical protein [Eubacteriales]|uniref:hypothetical protein n=1 Tax=Eubacteriales TaxID=186802 RepID=UPI0039935F96
MVRISTKRMGSQQSGVGAGDQALAHGPAHGFHGVAVMEGAFDGTASTPVEQYENLRETYADIARICDPAKLPQSEEPRPIRLRSLLELRLLVLALYFEQDSQRICRYDCWGYFIQKTKKVTRYCDRVTNGQS